MKKSFWARILSVVMAAALLVGIAPLGGADSSALAAGSDSAASIEATVNTNIAALKSKIDAGAQTVIGNLEAMAAGFERNLAAAQTVMDAGGFLLPVATEDEPSKVIGDLEAMAAGYERNLAAAQEIMDVGGFLAPIGEVAEGSIPISDRAGLETIANNLSGTYHLSADIDLSGADWVPIGDYGNPFVGVFDGQGYTISNLTITEDDYKENGLFGYSRNATIKNVGMVDTCIDVSSSYISDAGGIVGCAEVYSSSLAIENCYNTGNISADSHAGGIAGRIHDDYSDSNSSLTIKNCYNTGDVSLPSSYYAGGIAGHVSASSVTIENCYNTGYVSSYRSHLYLGGIVGGAAGDFLTIENCYNAGDILSESSHSTAGGIVGYAVGAFDSVTIENCYNTGDVSSYYAGGIAGVASSSSLTIENCYNTGDVSSYYAGGIVGDASSSSLTIENCFNSGDVSSSGYTGGIVGYTSSSLTIENCYNSGDVSSSGYATGGIVGYTPSSSSLTIENCYNTGDVSSSGSYAGGIVGYAVGASSSLTIENCYNTGDVSSSSSSDSYTGGIVGDASSSSLTIKSCYNTGGVSSPSTSDSSSSYSSYVGGIAGCADDNYSSSTITIVDCYNAGDISSSPSSSHSSYAGGIVGSAYAYDSSTIMITDCYNAGDVSLSSSSSYSYAGGIAGLADAHNYSSSTITIVDCYNAGDVSLSSSPSSSYGSYAGGIVGYADTGYSSSTITIVDCYNVGDIFSSPSSSHSSYAGGIVGCVYASASSTITIADCYNAGDVSLSLSSSSYAGGIVGSTDAYAYDSSTITITDCYNTGVVSVSLSSSSFYSSYAGGIVGYADGASSFLTIENCYNAGDVSLSLSSSSYAGGIVGYADGASFSVTIENCYNTGDVSLSSSSSSCAGGIVGDASSSFSLTVESCYSTGGVSSSSSPDSYTGGIVGYAGDTSFSLTIENCYNSGDVSSSGYTGGIVGYTPSSSSSLTIENCYNTGDVFSSGSYAGGIVGYADDISFSLTIENCYNTGDVSSVSSAGGITGYADGVSFSLTIENCYNTGDVSSSYAGGIVGYTFPSYTPHSSSISLTIENCNNTGDVSSSDYAGGIVGYAVSSSSLAIENCYNMGDVSSSDYAGGVVGYAVSYPKIKNCHSGGDVSSDSYAGGIAGWDSGGSITDCSNDGSVTSTGGSAGGAVGSSSYDTISNFTGNGVVIAKIYAGGVVGQSTSIAIENSIVNAPVSLSADAAGSSYAGGMIGYASGSSTFLPDCFYVTSSLEPIGYSSGATVTGLDHVSKPDTKIELSVEPIAYVGEEIYISGNFSSSYTSPNSETLTWSCSNPSAVSFGQMSVLGTKESAIISIPVQCKREGFYTITVTAFDGASASVSFLITDTPSEWDKPVISSTNDTTVSFSKDWYGATLGETLFVTGSFVSSALEADPQNLTFTCEDSSGVSVELIGISPDNTNSKQGIFSVQLSCLKTGTYTLRIAASDGAYGEAILNISKPRSIVDDYKTLAEAYESALKSYAKQLKISLSAKQSNEKTREEILREVAEKAAEEGVIFSVTNTIVDNTKTKNVDEAAEAEIALYSAFIELMFESQEKYDFESLSKIKGVDSISVGVSIVNAVKNAINKGGSVTKSFGNYKVEIYKGVSIFGIGDWGYIKCTLNNSVSSSNAIAVFAPDTKKSAEIITEYTKSLWSICNNELVVAAKEAVKDLCTTAGIKMFSIKTELNEALKAAGFGDLNEFLGSCEKVISLTREIIELDDTSENQLNVILNALPRNLTFDAGGTISDPILSEAMDTVKNAYHRLVSWASSDPIEKNFWDNIGDFFLSIIQCPVDVSVLDEIGKEIAYIKDNICYSTSDDVFVTVDGDTKYVYVRRGLKVQIVVTPTDYGLLNWACEVYDNGELSSRLNFYDVSLTPGAAIYTTISTNEDISSVESISLQMEDDTIFANELLLSTEEYTVVIDVAATDGGNIQGGGEAVKGDPVKLYAYPGSDYIFIGWYEDSELVSADYEYEFAARNNRNLLAVFSEVEEIVPDDTDIVDIDKDALTWDTIRNSNTAQDSVTSNLTLPTSGASGSAISWASSNAAISNTGVVTRPANSSGDVQVTLTATLMSGEASDTVAFTLTVLELPHEADADTAPQAVAADVAALTWGAIKASNTAQTSVTSNLALPTTGANSTAISWSSSDATTVSAAGVVTRPAVGAGNKTVTLTATVTKGAASDTVVFTLTVPAQPGSIDDDDTPDNNQPVNNPPTGSGLSGNSTSTLTPAPDAKETAEPSPSPNGSDSAPEPGAGLFTDVSESDWFYADVAFVRERGLMKGVSLTEFAPQTSLTRAMLVTILARNAGIDTTDGETWYSKAIEWGIASGITDGTNPNGDITREQFATMLYRYAVQELRIENGELRITNGDVSGYADAGQISDWAYDAMAWAVSAGIITGYPNGMVNPGGHATRAESAVMLHRYIKG
jgi:hypothetical protein